MSVYALLNRTLVLVFGFFLATTLPALAGQAPGVMLATVWEQGADPTGWLLSEKYDGVRGYWDGRQMWSRGGVLIRLPDGLRAALPPFALDGELWAGRGRFEEAVSTVRDAEPGPGWQAIRYLVFDAPDYKGGFEARIGAVEAWLAEHPFPQIAIATQTRCTGRDHLRNFLAKVESQGGEGVMLRAAGSPYEVGRSPHLRKLKSFDDTEARVIGYNPGKGKYQGMTGSLLVELPNGTRFSIGSGLTDAQRRNPPPIGSEITFKHYGWTKKGKPRFPVFWRIRK
jgi:DNA ligase-1